VSKLNWRCNHNEDVVGDALGIAWFIEAVDQVDKYCREWSSKRNLNKPNIILRKCRGILKTMNGGWKFKVCNRSVRTGKLFEGKFGK
jgi:hypothetical protein